MIERIVDAHESAQSTAHANSTHPMCRPIYAGNALQTVKFSTDGLRMLTVRTTAFDQAAVGSSTGAAVESVSPEELAAAKV